jgi:hypothetical protein
MPLRKIEDDENFIIQRSAIAGADAKQLQNPAQLIAPEQRQRFIKKLFGGDPAGFDQLLAQLEPAVTWSDAHRLIQNFFQTHGISPYQEDATRFSDLIYKRYFPKDEHI